jgi:hypothetical protein
VNYPSRSQQTAAIQEYQSLLIKYIESTSELARFSDDMVNNQPALLAAIWQPLFEKYGNRLKAQIMFADKGVKVSKRLIIALPLALAWLKNDVQECFGDPYSEEELKEIIETLKTIDEADNPQSLID